MARRPVEIPSCVCTVPDGEPNKRLRLLHRIDPYTGRSVGQPEIVDMSACFKCNRELMSLASASIDLFIQSNDAKELNLVDVITKIRALSMKPSPVSPAVPIDRSVTKDHIISLENGRPYKSLKRHLAKLGITPEQYRAKWGLADDYPLVGGVHAERKLKKAKKIAEH